MDSAKKRELMNAYKSRTVVGGVYCITCNGNNAAWIRATTDLDGAKNRFEFGLKMNSAPEPCMLRAFSEYGGASFSLTVLEELTKKETQTAQEFADDIRTLYEIRLEKAENGEIR